MLDQAFSAGNFTRIYERENRRGRNVDKRFFPELTEASARIGALSQEIRRIRRAETNASKEDLAAALAPLYVALKDAREQRDALVDTAMVRVAANAGAKGFQLGLTTKAGPKDIPLFLLREDAPSFFISKQLQRNVSHLYKVKPSDRRAIVRQVKDLVATSFNLLVVRTDISSFYESIDRKLLAEELDKDQLLSLASKSHIKCILMKYSELSNHEKGVPRGVGISAYLSELYMRSVDERIRQIEGITYYARYVDDIIAIFSPTAMDNRERYLKEIEAIVSSRGLLLNLQKTKVGPSVVGAQFMFEYLGYDFHMGSGSCDLDLTAKKLTRYKGRLTNAFDAYRREAGADQKGASRRLLARIKFLTGNTRLVNSKGFAFTGIYYNNSELTKLGKLAGLDAYLNNLASQLSSSSLKLKISRHSFKDGFELRRFYRYSTRELASIVEAWSYEA